MNKNVSTLLGIVIILLVALLVIGIYSVTLYKNLAEGKVVTGMQGAITGTETPTEVTGPTVNEPVTEGVPATAGKPGGKPGAKPEAATKLGELRQTTAQLTGRKGHPKPAAAPTKSK